MYDIYPDNESSSRFQYSANDMSTCIDNIDTDEIDGTRFHKIKLKFESMIKKNTQSLLISPLAKKRIRKDL